MASFGRDGEGVLPIMWCQMPNNPTGCLGATVVDRKGASDYARSQLDQRLGSRIDEKDPFDVVDTKTRSE